MVLMVVERGDWTLFLGRVGGKKTLLSRSSLLPLWGYQAED